MKRNTLPLMKLAIESDFADPSIIKAADGYYYAYGSQYLGLDSTINIQVARSSDLATWEHLGDALPAKASWARTTQDYWAPHVVYLDGLYYLYYCATLDSGVGSGIGVAVAPIPTGPFVDCGAPLVYGEGFEHIDPMFFHDPVSQKNYLYWGSFWKPIHCRELAYNYLTFKEGSETFDVRFPSKTTKYENLIEGAYMVYRDGYYYLFYTGDQYEYYDGYAVLVARSQNPTGPFIGIGEELGLEDNAILKFNERWGAPGQNCVFTDDYGKDWIAYHAFDRLNARIQGTGYIKRSMLLSSIDWVDGWPVVVVPHEVPVQVLI